MFNFLRRIGGKADTETAESARKQPSAESKIVTSVDSRAPRNDCDVTNENRKDVVNLLIPQTNYNQKTGVGAFLQMMAGKKKKVKNKTGRAESCRVSPPKEMQTNLQRSKSDLETRRKHSADDVAAPTPAKNNLDASHADADPADFVKALVLQRYANKSPADTKQHVSLVYVSDEPHLEEKRRAEALLREIAKTIDCAVEKINVNKGPMGAADSKTPESKTVIKEPVYETIDERNSIDSYKNELKDELERLLQNDKQIKEDDKSITEESPALKKKSNLKPPKSDTEGCSDDDRSETGKKRVTFRKHIVFDDGDQQTDEEIDSFESLTSEDSDSDDYLEDTLPDNDELLGGVVVSRNEENKTIINVTENNNEPIKIKVECGELQRLSSDNSDSGFIEISEKTGSGDDLTSDVKCVVEESEESASEQSEESEQSEVSETESETDEEVIIEEIVEEISEEEEEEEVSVAEIVEPLDPKHFDNQKTLVSQETKFQSQVAALTELADSRCGEAEKARDLIVAYRKEIEAKDQEIERLKCELAAAYKESELVRQRSRSLEEELSAARTCSAELADQLHTKNDDSLRQLKAELKDVLTQKAQLETRVQELEQDKERLEEEKIVQEQKATEALAAAEANTDKWRIAHESARSQAAARAELMLADCEWKMRELEKRAREAEKNRNELTKTVEDLKVCPPPNSSHIAELQQLRGLATEQQRSVQSFTLQLQKVETREEALKLEVHRLRELLDKEARIGKEKEERHFQTVERLEQQHNKAVEALKAEHASAAASSRAALERNHAERTRVALAQLREESERDARNADRKLREVTTRFENLKEVLASKESQFEHAIAEAHSKADWDILQLRHLLDKADITYANNVEKMNERFERERESLIKEWTEKVRVVEEQASTAAAEAGKLLESTRNKLISEKNEQINKLKEQHRQEMDEQWEQFMFDKETCLSRMKLECRQEGEEERVKREKDLLEEIAELKATLQSKSVDFDTLVTKSAACGRTLAVTEQELREALAREKELREKRADDATKIKQVERASKDQIEHLTRKCACLRKLFDDMRARLSTREISADQDSKAKDKEINHLRAEVARLTKLLMEQGNGADLGARTKADGRETTPPKECFPNGAAEVCDVTAAPRRKGGTLKTPEFARRRIFGDLSPLPPEARRSAVQFENGRRRAKSVDLPAVQVPVRIKQLEEKTKE